MVCQCSVQWFQQLPVGHPHGDHIEARLVHKYLVELVEDNNEVVLSYIPHIVQVFAVLLDNSTPPAGRLEQVVNLFDDEDTHSIDLVDDETRLRVIDLLKQMSSTMPADDFQQCIDPLPEDLQNALSKVLQ